MRLATLALMLLTAFAATVADAAAAEVRLTVERTTVAVTGRPIQAITDNCRARRCASAKGKM
jgi:hypothetical protein